MTLIMVFDSRAARSFPRENLAKLAVLGKLLVYI